MTCVDDRAKVDLKAWIFRYAKRKIWMYEYAFENAVTRDVTSCLGIEKSHSSLYDIYFIDFDGGKRGLSVPLFLKDLLIPWKGVMTLVV